MNPLSDYLQHKPEVMEIQLSRGKTALVDQADYETLNKHKWSVGYDNKYGRYVARRTMRDPSGKRVMVLMHRVIINAPKNMQVDHIDGNPLNNVRSNLRLATGFQNAANRFPMRGSTSKYMGVSLLKERTGVKCSPWRAQITKNNRCRRIGVFKSEIEAALAYDLAARELHGEFAKLNFPEQQNLKS